MHIKLTWNLQATQMLSNRFKSTWLEGMPSFKILDIVICFALLSFSELKHAKALVERSSFLENWVSCLMKWVCKKFFLTMPPLDLNGSLYQTCLWIFFLTLFHPNNNLEKKWCSKLLTNLMCKQSRQAPVIKWMNLFQ